MLDKNQQQFISGTDGASVIQSLTGTLYQLGVPVQQTGPNQWGGRGQVPSYGMVPKVSITITEGQGGLFCDVRVAADFETNGVVILVLAWLFFFPAAILLGYFGYQDWEQRQANFFHALWTPLSARIAAPPGAPQWGAPQNPLAPPGYNPPAGGPGGFGGGGPPGGFGGGQA